MYVIIFKTPNNGMPLISRQFMVHKPVFDAFNNKTKRGIPIYSSGPYIVRVT